ncbi:L-2-hydroxyglutarate oxidase [Hydrogenibacillus sp. N12]|uniref:L-2-hydroxyglutarate oxidase n=1 Tax=Hydrogenibacillus sp. N12 TaxID=2866627 RepID=UPI001C7D7804|nr:L-2-hydroxyglutarate oxidase [Hydrogenibacillus sp. N12]QZA32698.1 L-2-hydroxyglutarate oxidase [Hydrogenibacillus sp. N12]
MDQTLDLLVVGGGIVGLATAYRFLERRPDATVVVLEKEDDVARHQTGRNSGVIHSGIYYRPGSLKARFAREGGEALFSLAKAWGLPHARPGKALVARDEAEAERLEALYVRGRQNGLRVEWIGPDDLRTKEPHVRAHRALWVPETGVIDFAAVARALREEIVRRGGAVRTGHRALALFDEGARVRAVVRRQDGDRAVEDVFFARRAVNAAGLWSDRLARASGLRPPVRIVPFRGEYFELRPERRSLIRGLVYPVPDPRLPFLGVHFTRGVDGAVHVGPNAVLAWAREGYDRRAFDFKEAVDRLKGPDFWRMAWRYRGLGRETMLRSWSRERFLREARTLVPALGAEDLVPGGAGVRAQAVRRDGTLEDDFVLLETGRIVHVLNAPSPAATAALAIGEALAVKIDRATRIGEKK